MKIKEVTSLVEWGLPDGESLPLLRCICGATWEEWHGPVLSIYDDDPTDCPQCRRRFFFRPRTEVYEVV